MSEERVVRTSGRTGVRIDGVLATVLLAELMTPSRHLWLVSPWVGDVDIIDNRGGAYDSVFADPSSRIYTFSDVLAAITHGGGRLSVVTRPDPFNDVFVDRLLRQTAPGRAQAMRAEDVHEKTLCGDDWLMTGSMNFTYRGMSVNDEIVSYRVDPAIASTARIDFTRRFGTAR
ncbi:phospholipase D-like domain-containing protein DpdK [Micromonospora sp. WMMD1128]|uniref:phospholipase D-like domain-containing protein DpdK n=1 Tax=Micromonospora TaxID=1873 RepID=UPI00248CA3A2|nr:phospholipase D-like domain-containing protein DpdK [Micromonospora sp. WMMD1128]WBB72595.1 phospholipase D-like domain-containing protein DpdK [Micromonospora sp. WMMD1128]